MCLELFIALDLKHRQAKNSKADREKSNMQGMSLMGKKGNKERGESDVGVWGAEAAPTTDLAPAQIPPWNWASQAMFSQYVPDFFPYQPTDVQFLDLIFYLNSVSLKTILHDYHL